MNTYAYLIKAKAKSDKKSLFCFFDAKSDSRAEREIANILEDAEIETGRGCDYLLPIRTNLHVVDDLPEERVLDDTWCDRYELGEDGLTWQQIPTAPKSTSIQEEHKAAIVESVAATSITKESTYATGPGEEYPQLVDTQRLPFRQKLIAAFSYEGDSYPYHISKEQLRAVVDMEMDTDNTYVQNLLLAAENVPAVKAMDINNLLRASRYVKQVWPLDGKLPELGKLIQFLDKWSATAYTDQGLFAKEWAAGNQIDAIQRTDTGLNAGGGNKTDRSPDYTHTLETLDYEIAAATLPMDFDIYNIPGSIHRRAKEIVTKKESPFKEWSAVLRRSPGILDYSRAAIFAVIRSAHPEYYKSPGRLSGYINANLTETDHAKPTAETLSAARQLDSAAVVAGVIQGTEPVENLNKLSSEFSVVGKLAAEAAAINRESVDKQLAAERGEFVEGISNPKDPQWIPGNTATTEQPASTQLQVANLGAGIFSIEGLMGNSTQAETTSHVPMEETHNYEIAAGAAVPENEIAHEDAGAVAVTPNASTVLANAAPEVAAAVTQQNEPQNIPETIPEAEPVKTVYPEYFEPGRYEGIPNEVYHAANGISSTQVKDARVSLMYFNGRHVAKTIAREKSKVLDMGSLVHALALQPENLEAEFSIEPVIPEGAFTTTATIRAFIDKHNASLVPQLSGDDIKVLLEEYNATLVPPLSIDEIKVLLEAHNAMLPAQIPVGTSIEETGQSYMGLPHGFQRIEEGQKQTAAAMKACIKEYNATLPAPVKTSGSRETLLDLLATINPEIVELELQKPTPVKTSGSREALLEQLAIINPDLVAQETQKPAPLKVSGTKADMIQAVKSVNPDAVFADELLDAWRENPEEKILVTRQQYATALNMQKALFEHPEAGKLLQKMNKSVEVSYFGMDEETGLEIRVRPDVEIELDGVRIAFDLKTISMWDVKEEALKARLHREITTRDYHLSAAMYSETASFDRFAWIFVNKDEGYHWVAVVWASRDLLELGMLEYRTTMKAIAHGFDTGEWPAPITEEYSDELNDFDLRRLEALRALANA